MQTILASSALIFIFGCMWARSEFGHVIVNDDLERATDELVRLVRAILPAGEALPEAERP